MKTMRTNPLALAVMSALFFCIPITSLTGTVLRSLAIPLDVQAALMPVMDNFSLLGFISLCGGIAFLMSTREENPSWYLGIPLCLAFAIIALSPVVSGILVIRGMNPPIYDPGILWILMSQAAFFLLPPCAALFFWSRKDQGRWVPVLTGIALVVTLGSLAALYFAFFPYLVSAGLIPPPQPHYIDGQLVKTDGEGLLFLFFHYMVGMPVLGICFLALAAYYWYTARKAFPAPPLVPEAQP
jgi:hypothetical protein